MGDLYQEFVKYKRTKRLVIVLVVLVLIGGTILGTGIAKGWFDNVFNKISPRYTYAQFLPMPMQFVWQVNEPVTQITRETGKVVKKTIWQRLQSLSAIAYKNAIKNFFGRLAFEGASNMASSMTGQKPAFETNVWKSIQQQADGALGDYLNNTVGKMWGKDLCEPLEPLTKVRLEITAKRIIEPPKPQCKSSQIRRNLQRLKLDDLVEFSDYFNPSANDLGAILTITSGTLQKRAEVMEKGKLRKLIEGEFKPVTGIIDNDVVRTPAGLQAGYYAGLIDKSLVPYGVYTGDAIADAVGVFTNTLTSKLLQHYLGGIYKPKGEQGGGGSYSPSYGGVSRQQAVREQFADLGEIDYNFGGTVDVLANLSCGTEHQFSCVIDSQLKTALEQRPYLTVKEAIEQHFLHGDWPFGFEGKSKGMATTKENIYSYRSIVIMRKYRIVPVGWELAAEYFGKYDRSGRQITLASLIKDYNNPDSPYYKLVDPGWVLKAPQNICLKQGPGELTQDETIVMSVDANLDGEISEDEKTELVIRLDYCADERSCIKEGDNGCEYYGYCTEEKPIWSIHGNKCEAVFNSCRAYTTRDGVQVSYLKNSVAGNGLCGQESVGCREYAKNWIADEYKWDETGDRTYLNYQAGDNECDKKQDGCSRFIRVDKATLVDENMTHEEAKAKLDGSDKANDGSAKAREGEDIAKIIDYEYSPKTNLKKAPDYFKCDGYTNVVGTDKSKCSSPNFWRDDIESCVESGSDECADYALYCQAEDEGCKFYEPLSYSGPDVPGVVGEYDNCPAECVGYKSYLEQPSFFEPIIPATRENPINFIANTAQTCPASHNGCEEFTNLSEGSAGEKKEYYSTMRYCVTPDENNADIIPYYSWASSEESGNQLRTWTLLKSNLGGWPCTNIIGTQNECNDSPNQDDDNYYHKCSFGASNPEDNPVYNPDCIEFTDANGNSYWMKYSRVVFASEECTPFRRTYDQQVYMAIPRLSQTCSASSAGCREYKGSSANNIKIVLDDDFEQGTNEQWQGGELSNESVVANGHSLLALGEDKAVLNKDVSSLIHQGRSYKLSFWAKAAGVDMLIRRIYFTNSANEMVVFDDFFDENGNLTKQIDLHDEWNRYEVSLANLNREIKQGEKLGISGSGSFYIDNIQLTETQDDLYLIRDSWTTPESCQQTVDGRDMVGCEQYKDKKGKDWYLRSFERLCRDEVVGCELFIDMHNTENPAEETFNQVKPPVTVPADNLEYLVYDEHKKCSSVGCRALGLMSMDRDGQLYAQTKYLVADENNYGNQASPLCSESEVWCEKFTPVDKGLPEYFKFPNVFTCQYVQGPDGQYRWYQSGDNSKLCPGAVKKYCSNDLEKSCSVDLDCNSNGSCISNYGFCVNSINTKCLTSDDCNGAICDKKRYCIGGRSMLNTQVNTNICYLNSDCVDYASMIEFGICSNWTALCPASQNRCSEYQDPATPKGCDNQSVNGEEYHKTGSDDLQNNGEHDDWQNNGEHCDYYYYKSDSVETCDKINPDQGCLGFHEVGGGENKWFSSARCEEAEEYSCEVDADCVDDKGKVRGTGKCVY